MSRRVTYYGKSFASILNLSQIYGVNLFEWWRPEEITESAGNAQPSWQSQGSNGGLFTASAGRQPNVIDNALNGLKGLLFDGVDDYMEVLNSIGDYDFVQSSQSYILIVWKPYDVRGQSLLSTINTSAGGRNGFFMWDSISRPRIRSGNDGTSYHLANNESVQFNNTQHHLWNFRTNVIAPTDPQSSEQSANDFTFSNQNVLSSTYSSAQSDSNLRLGRTIDNFQDFLYGEVIEIAIVNTQPTLQQLTDTNAYLINKFGGTFPI